MSLDMKILTLSHSGLPKAWIDYEKAAYYECKGLIDWSMGEHKIILRGGTNRLLSNKTVLTIPSIIAIKDGKKKNKKSKIVRLNNRTLFARDRNICAYCGNHFTNAKLSRDHIHPIFLGGLDVWENVVTSCKSCNGHKGHKTLEEAGLKLLYVPYAPNLYENLILQNRKIKDDQMEFLLAGVPKHSRVHLAS